ncbi:hypothetical protein [Sinorhizobium arboris]|uniref:hypothetical protein n=1 Tax=Sinorhizobium arboris TaxID=76745 RepID=UPI00040F0B71|nr:hypothetical protein [Sinorhizobium arboris]
MTKVYTGSVFGIRELTEEQRAATREELVWLETDLVRQRKAQAETMPGIREELRQSAFHFHARAQDLVNSGERLRAYLVAELQDQPEHLPAYHHAH